MKLNLKAQTTMEGIYSFKAVNAFTGESRHLGDVADSPNMIVKAGLNAVGGGATLIYQCCIGTNSTTVTFNDTGLGAQIAATTTIQSSTYGAASSAPYYRWYRKTFRFDQGVAAGNLAEVGMKTSSGTLFSRALIVDSAGIPTTLSILEDEYLDVTYELRTYIDATDKVQTIVINGDTYTVTLRAADITSSSSYQDQGITSSLNSSTNQYFCSGYIGSVVNSASGASYGQGRSLRGNYITDSFERTFTTSAGLNYSNYSGGIQALYIQTSQGNFQAGFVPALPKNNYMIITIDLTVGWGVYDP